MLYSEFTLLTGFYPDADLYAAIENAYNSFDGDKREFCRAYQTNRDGLAEQIQRDVDQAAALTQRRQHIETCRLEREITRLKGKLQELETRLEREQEWQPVPLDSAMTDEDYARLAGDSTARRLENEEAVDLIAKEFGFERGRIGIIRQLHRREINRHRCTRIVGSVQRDPLFDAWDWNYIAFSVRGNVTSKYEMVNGELHQLP